MVPEGVTPAKVAGIRSCGATIVSDGVNFDNREEIAEDIAQTEGLRLIHPYDDWDVVHGAGTVGLEILEDMPAPGAVVVPIGGGGQISGHRACARRARRRRRRSSVSSRRLPMTRPRVCAPGSCKRSTADPVTLAEGVKSKSIGNRNFEVIVGDALVRDIVTVSEDELDNALRVCWTRLKLAIEPTAALALAAYLTGRVPAGSDEHPTVIVLSGGNFDPATVAALLSA